MGKKYYIEKNIYCIVKIHNINKIDLIATWTSPHEGISLFSGEIPEAS